VRWSMTPNQVAGLPLSMSSANRGALTNTRAARRSGSSCGVLDALVAVCGPDRVVTDPDVMCSFETDWTGVYRGRALAVVRPRDTAMIAAVISKCADAHVAVVPQ